MNIKSEALVLGIVKYGDNSRIVQCYTRETGKQNFMVHVSARKKNGNILAMPLTILDIEFRKNKKRDLQNLSRFNINTPYYTLHTEPVKVAVAQFLAEILNTTLRENSNDSGLFDFIIGSLQYFDTLEAGYKNFHLRFLLDLTRFLGFYPDNRNNNIKSFLNPELGLYSEIPYSDLYSQDVSQLILELTSVKIENFTNIKISGLQRTKVLDAINKFY